MARKSIFILIDALGWEKVCETDFLPELSATRRRLRCVLGYSGACQSALFSGKSPAQTGRWLMYYFTRRTETFAPTRILNYFPDWVKNRGPIRRRLRNYVARRVGGYFSLYCVPMEVFPHLELAEREDLYAPGGLAPARGIFDDLKDSGVPHSVWSWRIPEQESLDILLRELHEDQKRFFVVYWTRLDALMHVHGVGSEIVDRQVRWYEDAIRRILETSSPDGETRLFIFSDHGMIDTRSSIDLMAQVTGLGLTFGKDYVAFYDSTMARFSFRTDRGRDAICSMLRAQDGGELLDDETLKSLGVFYPDRRYGDAVFLTQPGVLIVPSFMGPSAPKAMHGFHPDCPGSDAHLVSNAEVGMPADSILDLYSIMKQELSG
ncbi:MAG: alkaline phosphatase family protein [Candidatus Eisenbacteria sp.]|nr:alkaline phosphatase family protein [Candidatus Eisenbacteria bacterium]